MSILPIAKGAVHIVSALGVTKVLSDVLKQNTVAVTRTQKILVNAGGLVLGLMVSEKAEIYVSSKLDRAVAWLQKRKDDIEKPEEK